MEYALPMLALLTWTTIIWWALLLVRLSEIKAKKLLPHQLNTPEDAKELLSLRQNMLARNFANLLELPLLFYILGALSIILKVESEFSVLLAWLFVGSRVAHSLIHTGYNTVLHRFYAYVLGGLVLTTWVITMLLNTVLL
ncbi:MAPEG family protein [Umboniibacter marinipuniceus]|uniref:MAPEG family protein n=1 Tax=Umboniibacter marinipuniceus TaxID=569599 RepID=A0A3M0AHZ1_9GAMM|nr:MAPEG family protein [Umboniibacter marinipuniceus]RMA82185.1 hypothetical protein DFR27_0133 [Umboniibacter marinipuniceus]